MELLITGHKETIILILNLLLTSKVGNLLYGFSSESLRVMGANHSRSLFCKVKLELLANGHSFLKSNNSELLPLLLQKERCSEERWEQFALGLKKGESSEKHTKSLILREQFARITSESLTLLILKSDKSKE